MAAPSRTISTTSGALPLRFFALAFAFTWFFWGLGVLGERGVLPALPGFTVIGTFGPLVPALASVAARLALREGFADVSFRFGGRRGWGAIGFALVFPVVIGLVAYGVAWTTGLAGFDPSPVGGLIVPFVFGVFR